MSGNIRLELEPDLAGAGARAGAKIRGKVEPELEPKLNNFGSATLLFYRLRLWRSQISALE